MTLALLGLSPNMQLMAGLGIVAAALFFSMGGGNKFSGVISKIISLFKGGSPSSPDSVPGSIASYAQVHQVCSALMAYFSSLQDVKGLHLAAAIGQHVYSREIDEKVPQVRTPAPESVFIPGRGSFPKDSGVGPGSVVPASSIGPGSTAASAVASGLHVSDK